MSDRVQSLIFLKSGVVSTPEGYTLVGLHMRSTTSDTLLSLLSSTAPYVSYEQLNPPQNAKFDMIEVWLELGTLTQLGVSQRLRVYVNVYNLDQVRQLLPAGSNVQFVTKFRINDRCNQKYTALRKDNLKIIEKLLASGADIKWRRPEGGTTLAHFAAEKGSAPLIALLRQFDVSLDAGRDENTMPLHAAVKKKNRGTVQALLDNGADIDGTAADGFSALHLATKAGLSEIAQLLAEKGACLEAKTSGGWTSLHLAADVGNLEIVSLLLAHGADLESKIDTGTNEGATALHAAIKKERWAVAKLLVESGASLNAECRKGRNALCFAVATGDINFMQYLINRGLDVTSPGNKKAFYLAFRRDYSCVLKKMMALGFSVGAADMAEPDVLFGAIHKNFFEMVKSLLESGADVHQKHSFLGIKTTPIHVACRYADAKMVQLLLDHGADPCAVRGVGSRNTTMADAVESGKVETVKLLLAKNISVRDQPGSDIFEPYSVQLLRKATEQRQHELMELLLENGAAVGCKRANWSGDKLPITVAALMGDKKAAEILMKYGANFNFEDISCDSRYSWHGSVTPEFLKAFLPYGFTNNLDAAATAHLREDLKRCGPVPRAEGSDLSESEDDYFDGNWMKRECAKVIAQFVVKMEAAGMIVAGSTVGIVLAPYFEAFKLVKLQRECEEEVDLMKARQIAQTRITLFDLLTKTSNRVARYMQIESIRNELRDYEFEIKYPHYGRILRCQFGCGNWRHELLDKGIKKLNLLNCQFRALPFELKERIAGFLKNQDLLAVQKCSLEE